MVSISEVVLNRYLREYTKDMIDDLTNNPFCPDVFGYKIPSCIEDCKECYKRGSHNFEQKELFEFEPTVDVLRAKCKKHNIQFKPTEELINLLKAGE